MWLVDDIEWIVVVCELIGLNIVFMVDVNYFMSVEEVIVVVMVFKFYDIIWFEELIILDDY